jgi:GNAT superfamily N-acetyltransferase
VITYQKLDESHWQHYKPQIMALEAMAFSAAQCHPESFYQNIIDNSRSISYIALLAPSDKNTEEKVVGFSFSAPLELFAHYPGVRDDPFFDSGKVLYGADMVVDPAMRKQGIGKAFKHEQLLLAKALGYEVIAGRNRLQYAHAMWCVNQALGAVEIQRLKGIYQDGREPNECIYYHITL